MKSNRKEMIRENVRFLQGLMILLNVSTLIVMAILGWAVYTLIENSSSLYKMISGDFIP